MEHVAIFGFVCSLVTGASAGFAVWQSFIHNRQQLLLHLLHFIALFNTLVFLYLISKYLYVNVLAGNLSAIHPMWWVLLYLAGFCAEAGVGYTVIQLTYACRERAIPKVLVRVFVILISLFGASFVAGSTVALYGGGFDWLRLSYASLLTTMTLSAIAFLAALTLREHTSLSPARSRSVRLLGGMLLLGWVVFTAVPVLPEPLPAIVGTLDLVWLNLAPIVWLKLGFERGFTRPLSQGQDSALDTLTRRFALSNREHEVVGLILRGKSNKEIEELLFISANTVKNHVYNIFRKAGVRSRGQLVNLFITAQEETKAIEPPPDDSVTPIDSTV